MNKKVLIIDDNHSFIDTLKYILKDIQLDFESAFRFQEAAGKISDTGRFRNAEKIAKILDFEVAQLEYEQEKENLSAAPKKKNPQAEEENQKKLESLKAPVFPKIKNTDEVFNDNGYSIIIVEYDTEVSVKGLQFIQNLVENTGIWKYSDFILLTSRYNELKPTADSLGLAILEKPVKAPQMLTIVAEKVKQMDALREKASLLIDRFAAKEEIKPEAKKTTTRKRKTPAKSATTKSTAKRKTSAKTNYTAAENKKSNTKKT